MVKMRYALISNMARLTSLIRSLDEKKGIYVIKRQELLYSFPKNITRIYFLSYLKITLFTIGF